MKFDAHMIENVPVNDVVQRTVKGVRHKKNYYAILAFIVIISFEAFVILSSSTLPYLIINWTFSFIIFVSGLYAISRIENYLRITTRNTFTSKNTHNPSQVSRRCNVCNTRFDEFPCPNCGKNDAPLIVVNTEVIAIPESRVAVMSNFLTKTSFFWICNSLYVVWSSMVCFILEWGDYIIYYFNFDGIDIAHSIILHVY